MLLAAGRGERMGCYTASVPKPLLDVGGKALIVRHLEALALAGVREVVINIAYRGDMIKAALGSGARWGVAIQYSDEGQAALETAGGIVNALPLLGQEPFLVVSADVVHDFDLSTLSLGPGMLGQLVLVRNRPHHPRGDFGIAKGGLLTVEPPRMTFAGIALLAPGLFAGLRPGLRPLRGVLRAAIGRRQMTGCHHRGTWVDVGTPARLRVARRLLGRLA